MCGILCHYKEGARFNAGDGSSSSQIFQSMVPAILERGSDYSEYYAIDGPVEMFSSVLSLRQPLTRQPMRETSSRFVLQFNGELYNRETLHSNDTRALYERLVANGGDVVRTIAALDGEFAYCITDTKSLDIYFGKDPFGKRSLMYKDTGDGELYVSSCPPQGDVELRDGFEECKPGRVYKYDGRCVTEEIYHAPFQVSGSVADLGGAEEAELVTVLQSKLEAALEKRIETIFPVHPESDGSSSEGSSLAVLFSGGIDCTILAALAASKLQRPIDLLNVSFSNPRAKLDPSQTPDRKLAVKCCEQLTQKYGPLFNLVEVDVPYEEYIAHKKRVVDLIYPNDTAMDLSIAIAFYFAAGGCGHLASDGRVAYQSKHKVLLSGLGADELFGGYTRHEKIYTAVSNQRRRVIQGKPPKDTTVYDVSTLPAQLRDELQEDLSRLWIRNLARDDKVISCWSKEARYAYLDDKFAEFVATEVPLNYKLRYDPETGGITRKYILRRLALRLGLDWVAEEPKRAIQFGAKSAKMEVGTRKARGTDKIDL